jgi:hypothetical protein
MSESERFQSNDVLKAFQSGAETVFKSVITNHISHKVTDLRRIQLGKWSFSFRKLPGRML